jgi:cell division protein FtsA
MSSPDHLVALPRLRPLSARRAAVVAALDVGSAKICCVIGRLRPSDGHESLPSRSHAVEILGLGLHRSQGIKTGVVVDMDAAEQAIRLAVDAAEREARATVEAAILNVSCGRLQSETFSASVNLAGGAAAEADIQRVLRAGAAHSVKPGRVVLHSLPIGYALDGHRGIREPRGMVGEQLSVDMHVATVEAPPLKNLLLCVERCHVSVEALVATPYASGLASLVDDESELGCAVVDMGAGTTSVAVFFEGYLIHADAVAVGGQHVTLDVARGLSVRLSTAERIKTLHGNALSGSFDSCETITLPPVSEDESEGHTQVPRDQLNRIVRARVEETLELVRDRLQASGVAGRAARRIVLTGGASQLPGTAELARQILGRQVRAGRPLGVSGLPEIARGPAFSGTVGLLVYPQVVHLEHIESRRNWLSSHGGYLARMGKWIRDSF